MSNYVNKTDGKFNHGKWIRENMSVMKNQDINGQGSSLAYRFTEPQQAAVEKFLKKNSTDPAVKELLATNIFFQMFCFLLIVKYYSVNYITYRNYTQQFTLIYNRKMPYFIICHFFHKII